MDPANSDGVMYPLPSRSKDLNTSIICSWLMRICASAISAPRVVKSSSNSMLPLPLESMFASSAWSWSPVGFTPSDRSNAANSRCVRLPSESRSNRLKIASRMREDWRGLTGSGFGG
ncbi:hypothetical protein V2J09_004030 [Rumex salicifolius]